MDPGLGVRARPWLTFAAPPFFLLCRPRSACRIVGKNGSGKTTIIETLAMATTGTLPPNCRNGQAFINDPNIHGGVEVRRSSSTWGFDEDAPSGTQQ